MGEQNRNQNEHLALSTYIDRSTSDYYENLYSIPFDNLADNIYSEAEYGNYEDFYDRVK